MTEDRKHDLQNRRLALAHSLRRLAEQCETANVEEPDAWTAILEALMAAEVETSAIHDGIVTA